MSQLQRMMVIFLTLIWFCLCSCGMNANVKAVLDASTRFHTLVDAGKIEDAYNDSAESFRQKTSAVQCVCRNSVVRLWALTLLAGTALTIVLASGFAMDSVHVPIKARGAGPLFQIRRGAKWGYMDRQGHIVVRPQFDDEHAFIGGLAAVREGARWGYINETGIAVTPYEFDDAGDFVEGLAPVRSGRKWGFVDRAGRLKIVPQFQAAARFSDGLARFEIWDSIQCDPISPKEGPVRYTRDDAPLYAFRDHSAAPVATGGCFSTTARYGFVDKSGKIAIKPNFVDASDFSGGVAAVRIGNPAKWGYIDRSGRVVIEPRFVQVLPFSEGLAAVHVGESDQSAGTWGFIGPEGRFVIPPKFRDARSFSGGLAEVELSDGLWGYTDKSGALAVEPKYVQTSAFSEGLALVWPSSDIEGYYIDRGGRRVLVLKLWPQWPFSDGLTVAGREGERKYVDRQGKIVAAYETP